MHSIPAGERAHISGRRHRIAVFRTRQGVLFARRPNALTRRPTGRWPARGQHPRFVRFILWKFDLATGQLDHGDCTLENLSDASDPGGQIVVMDEEKP